MRLKYKTRRALKEAWLYFAGSALLALCLLIAWRGFIYLADHNKQAPARPVKECRHA